MVARKLLTEQGIEIPEETLKEWKEERKAKLKDSYRRELTPAREEEVMPTVLNPGLRMYNASMVDMDTGVREFIFSEKERRKGLTLFFIGAILLAIIVVLKILSGMVV